MWWLKKLWLFLGVVCAYNALLVADTITIYNKTNLDFYAGIYIYKPRDFRATIAPKTTIVKIPAGGSQQLERPSLSWSERTSLDRNIYFAPAEIFLKNVMEFAAQQKVYWFNVGQAQGDNFFIAFDGKTFKGYNRAEWFAKKEIIEPLEKTFQGLVDELQSLLDKYSADIKSKFAIVKDNPYKSTVATVRQGNELSNDEKSFLKARKKKVKQSLEALLGRPLQDNQVPVIALVESGGGYRAMTCSVGFHVGLTNIGVMDTVTYMAGLSGSTWSIGLWTLSGLPIEQFKAQLIPKMRDGLDRIRDRSELQLIIDNLLVKAAYDQELTGVDLFGGLLTNALLIDKGNMRQRVYLSQQQARMQDGAWPMPIYTAVRGDRAVKQEWFEFTPYEIGSPWLGMYVPTWAFGRKFNNGASVGMEPYAPEQSFGYMMGTFGSAFSASFNQMMDAYISAGNKLQPPYDALASLILQEIGHDRVTAATVFNFTYGMPNSPVKNDNKMMLVDGGLEFNLPYPPISGKRPERKADIIIIMDASAGSIPGELQKMELFARTNGLKFPVINYNNINKQVVSIFKDENDPTVPLVIYMPRISDAQLLGSIADNVLKKLVQDSKLTNFNVERCIQGDYCSTFNFKYADEQAKQLSALMEFNVRANKAKILEAIKWKVEHML